MATTAIAGAALARGLVPPTGVVSSIEPLASVPLPDFGQLVFGGHEVADTSLPKKAELLADEGVLPPTLPATVALARKRLGFRYVMNVVPLDPSLVRGTHGRLPERPAEGPVMLCSDAQWGSESIAVTEVRDLLLGMGGVPVPETQGSSEKR